MSKKIVGGLLAVLFVTSMVQTSAIVKLGKLANAPKVQTTNLASASTNSFHTNQEASVGAIKTTKFNPDVIPKSINPVDIANLKTSIQNINKSIQANGGKGEDTSWLQRILCFLSGGIWMQSDDSHSAGCFLPEDRG